MHEVGDMVLGTGITPTRVGLVAKRRGRSPTDVYNDVYTF
jgi:hypothetical protein